MAAILTTRIAQLLSERRPWVALAIGEAGLAVLVLVVGLTVQPDQTPHPERVTAQTTACQFTGSAVQVGFSVTNGDVTEHKYKVEISVFEAAQALGSTTTLVNHLRPGGTAEAGVLVAVNGGREDVECRIRAEVSYLPTGHHD